MDLKEIIDPIVEGTVWTFDNLLLPLTKHEIFNFNNVAILAICAGIVFWVIQQGKYNKKADAEGSIR